MRIEDAQLAFDSFLKAYKEDELDNRLLEPVKYILSLGGKRLRPAIAIWLNQLYNGDIKEGLNSALAIEMFHNFSLVHDDIMDEAPLRRGKETVHKKWDTNTAILSGDAMLVLVYKVLSELNDTIFKPSMKLFNESALNVCEGQQLDMDFEKVDVIEIEDYLTMIGLKTGDLLGASFALGALSANASQSDVDHLYSFGKKTGIAFQLQDDILDLYGDQKKVGKQIGGDIIANKKTCLWIRAFEKANENQKVRLKNMVDEKNPQEKVKLAASLFEELEVKKEGEEIKLKYQKEAFDHLDKVSLGMDKRDMIKRFAMSLLSREY